jgi:hypothetical protein
LYRYIEEPTRKERKKKQAKIADDPGVLVAAASRGDVNELRELLVGLDATATFFLFHHVRLQSQNTVQLMTASVVHVTPVCVHVTNRVTPPGSE